jgi:hypothetical protein
MQSRFFISIRFGLVLLGLLLQLSGCGVLILGGAAVGTVGYVSGDLEASVEGHFHQVVKAADQTIEEDSISVLSKDVSSYSVTYILKTPQNDKVDLKIIYATKNITNVTIRVGVFGDEPLSRRILKEIESRL